MGLCRFPSSIGKTMLTTFLLLSFVVFRSIHSSGMPCSDENDKLLGSSCFEFVQLPLTNLSTGDSLYDYADAYCMRRQKRVAVVKSAGEQYFLANSLRDLHWSEAIVGLQYRSSAWTWTSDNTLLRSQGCMQTTIDSDSMQQLPSKYSNSMSPGKCLDFCARKERIFSALQGNSYCYCSNEFLWKEQASNCSVPCASQTQEECASAFSSALQFTAEDAYDNWLDGRPSNGGHCAAIQVDGNLNSWVDVSCGVILPFFCKFVDTKAQPYGADRSVCSQNACYYYFSMPELTWQAADKFCIKGGGRLATVESEDRQAILDGVLSDPFIKASQVWIGATSKDWYFPDDSTITLREGWASVNEPINQEQNSCADLIVAMSDDLVYGWRSRPCTKQSDDVAAVRFICSSAAQDSDGADGTVAVETESTQSSTTPKIANSRIIPAASTWLTTSRLPKNPLMRVTEPIVEEVLADQLKPVALAEENETQTLTPTASKKDDGLASESLKQSARERDDNGENFVSESEVPWWSILLLIVGLFILVGLVVLVTIYIFKKSRNRGKHSGRISPLSDRPMMGKMSYASSRQSSARTTHGRNNQVLLY